MTKSIFDIYITREPINNFDNFNTALNRYTADQIQPLKTLPANLLSLTSLPEGSNVHPDPDFPNFPKYFNKIMTSFHDDVKSHTTKMNQKIRDAYHQAHSTTKGDSDKIFRNSLKREQEKFSEFIRPRMYQLYYKGNEAIYGHSSHPENPKAQRALSDTLKASEDTNINILHYIGIALAAAAGTFVVMMVENLIFQILIIIEPLLELIIPCALLAV